MEQEKQKRAEREAGMGYYPFMVLSHDTKNCIVTQGSKRAGAWSGTPLHGAVGLRHDQPARETRPACVQGRAAANARRAWPQGVSQYVSWRGATFCVTIRLSKAAI